MHTFIAILILLGIWSIWGYFSSRVEQAQYSVITRAGDYEIRAYPSHIEAQTTVTGSNEQSMSAGFRIIAGYIFGGNAKRQGIAMTAPVRQEAAANETISMTAPVTMQSAGVTQTVSFVMPKSYSLDTLPVPNDARVKLVEVPAKKMAVLRFSWYRSTARIAAMNTTLLAALARDGVTAVGMPSYAGYNAPWTPLWMNRHEVMVEVT